MVVFTTHGCPSFTDGNTASTFVVLKVLVIHVDLKAMSWSALSVGKYIVTRLQITEPHMIKYGIDLLIFTQKSMIFNSYHKH